MDLGSNVKVQVPVSFQTKTPPGTLPCLRLGHQSFEASSALLLTACEAAGFRQNRGSINRCVEKWKSKFGKFKRDWRGVQTIALRKSGFGPK